MIYRLFYINIIYQIMLDVNNEQIIIFLKLFLLLYADDTVLFSDNEIDMQQALSVFETYSKEWKLTVNTEKNCDFCTVMLIILLLI